MERPWFSGTRFFRMALALIVVALLLSVRTFAADGDDVPWMDVPALPFQKPWVQWLFGAGFVILCLPIAFKNPHRSHLD
jgi:drug/metabolite transporter (DMT)-like permease